MWRRSTGTHVFALTRGFQHTRASLQRGKTISTRQTMSTKRQADVPAAVDETWHLTLLRQLWCAATGQETHKDASRTRICSSGFVLMSCAAPVTGFTSTELSLRAAPERCGHLRADEAVSGESFSDPCTDPFHRLAEVAKRPIRAQRRAVIAHGDALELLVKSP